MQYLILVPAAAVAIAAVLLHMKFNYGTEFPVCQPATSAVVVTGCSSGVGLNTAIILATAGYKVYASVRKVEEFELFSEHPSVQPILLDITNSTQIRQAAELVASDIERIRSADGDMQLIGLVNNAAIAYLAAVEEIDLHFFRKVMDVNVYGTVEVTQAFLPLVKRSTCGGRVVNVGSVSGVLSSPLYGAYSASKFALEAITDALRLEMEHRYGKSERPVSVSIVDPGSILDTSMRKKNIKVLPQYAKTEPSAIRDTDPEPTATTAPIADRVSPYEPWYKFTRERFRELESKRIGSPVEDVVAAIQHALADPHPQPRYLVGVVGNFPTWALSALSKGVQLLPTRAVDRILLAMVPKE